MVNAYRVPIGMPVDVLVLEYEDNFYSFGCTCRSSESVWREVKDRLGELETCNDLKEDILPHFYESFEGR